MITTLLIIILIQLVIILGLLNKKPVQKKTFQKLPTEFEKPTTIPPSNGGATIINTGGSSGHGAATTTSGAITTGGATDTGGVTSGGGGGATISTSGSGNRDYQFIADYKAEGTNIVPEGSMIPNYTLAYKFIAGDKFAGRQTASDTVEIFTNWGVKIDGEIYEGACVFIVKAKFLA